MVGGMVEASCVRAQAGITVISGPT
eukprot:SAG31_NODE_10197_length_1172_cov_1.088537_1_plen_24_part_10